MRCKKCGNRIKELFFYKDGEYVCRRCLVYKEKKGIKEYKKGKGDYKLDYDLTIDQYKASQFILEKIKSKEDCVLNAVTGAGKTEIIYPLIQFCVNNKKSFGIVIPRKDVVIELYHRIKKDFKNASVVMVCGGYNKELYGDIIILTSHQLYRYNNYFEVIIIDEVDAFPFYKNEILNNFLKRSLKGNIVYMSATIPEKFLKRYEVYYLNKRYHQNKLDIPKVKTIWCIYTIRNFIKKHLHSIILIYFPTIKEQIKFSKRLKIKHYLINSKTNNRKQLLEELHGLKSGVILTTLVLERGITFKNCHVIVYKADHDLFTSENLVQISGRVGRSKDYPSGDILFLVSKNTSKIKRSIKFIKKANE